MAVRGESLSATALARTIRLLLRKRKSRETLRKKRADEAMMDEVRFNTIHKVSKGTNKQTAWKG